MAAIERLDDLVAALTEIGEHPAPRELFVAAGRERGRTEDPDSKEARKDRSRLSYSERE